MQFLGQHRIANRIPNQLASSNQAAEIVTHLGTAGPLARNERDCLLAFDAFPKTTVAPLRQNPSKRHRADLEETGEAVWDDVPC